ncbi:MAG: glycoside hydrolase family 3 N-terminal domain-containing protein [Caldilineaceae bacterium]
MAAKTRTKEAVKPWLNAELPTAQRVELLLAEMTLDEKLQQIGSVWVYEIVDKQQALDAAKARRLIGSGIGQITRPAGASTLEPVAVAGLGNEIQRFLVEETRLGIPAMVHDECCAGVLARGATVFPQIIGVASTWQPELVEQMTDVIRLQMRALGIHHGLAPVLDIARDPRWGRIEETFGEDPYLTALMGVAYIKGLQGKDWAQGVVGTGKHLVGYAASEGGLNWAPVHLMARELREVYLLPFEAAIREAKLGTIMPAYHELDGVPCHASKELLTDILRGELGFTGLVVSDYFGINQIMGYHALAQNRAEAARLTLDAGMDLEVPSIDCFREPLAEAVAQGALDVARIDASVRRMLEYKFAFGIFENPYVDPGAVTALFDNAEQRALARTVAEKSLVLLKNDGTLPLPRNPGKIALIGPNADSMRNMVGDYSHPAHIETLTRPEGQGQMAMPMPEHMEQVEEFTYIVTALKGIGDALRAGGKPAQLTYSPGCGVLDPDTSNIPAAVKAAKAADVAIVVVGDKAGLTRECSTGEFRDRATLGLPGVQEELVKAVLATGTPTVVVLVNGRPYSIGWILDQAAAVLEAWLPGEEGGAAIASALFGDVNPGGKLPVTVVRSVGQVPLFYAHRPSGAKSFEYGPYVDESNEPLLPFGFGLSYTTFRIDNLHLDRTEANAGDTVRISVDVTNTGDRSGDEVVQFYTRTNGASVTRPVKELRGFQRVTLAPGERRTVTLDLALPQMAYLDAAMRLAVEPATVTVMAGSSSRDIAAEAQFRIVGPTLRMRRRRKFFNRVKVSR